MFFPEICILYIYALLNFRGVECVLLIKPQNLVAVSGAGATLHCASSASGNIVWKTTDPGSSQNEVVIYSHNVLFASVSSYISVSDSEDGNCSLNINVSLTAAKRYICTEADSGEEASAELIVLESGLQCNSTNGSEPYICSVTVSAGNWVPVVECYQWKIGVGLSVLQRNPVDAVDNNVSTRSWNYTIENEWFPIFCQTSFRPKESERPKESCATNIPEYRKQTLVYNGTCAPHSGTTSSSSSAGATSGPVTAATTCPTATTSCPVTAAAICPEWPTGATASPLTAAAKCPGCLAISNECHVTVNLKCLDFLAYQMAAAEKCPEYPAGAGERDVETAGERPSTAGERPTAASERPTAAGERPTADSELPTAAGERPTAASERPTEASERPTEAGERPTAASERPTEAGERPTAAGEHLTEAGERTEAAAGRRAAAAESPVEAAEYLVLAFCIASLVLNCMMVIAGIGYAAYKMWESNKKPEDIKIESVEQGTKLTPHA